MFIDGHCDTASVMLDEKKVLKKNDLQLDLTRMDKAQTQLFAAFIAPEYYDKPFERAEAIIAKLKKEIDKKTNKIELCTNNDERLLGAATVRRLSALRAASRLPRSPMWSGSTIWACALSRRSGTMPTKSPVASTAPTGFPPSAGTF